VEVEQQLIESPEQATRIGFHGSPTILVTAAIRLQPAPEPVGMMCRVYATDEGRQGAPTESQLRRVFARDLEASGLSYARATQSGPGTGMS
jgi:hypothetical protein